MRGYVERVTVSFRKRFLIRIRFRVRVKVKVRNSQGLNGIILTKGCRLESGVWVSTVEKVSFQMNLIGFSRGEWEGKGRVSPLYYTQICSRLSIHICTGLDSLRAYSLEIQSTYSKEY